MRAIDVHVHFSTPEGRTIKDREFRAAMERYYRTKFVDKSEEEMARDFVELDIKALLIPFDAEANTGWERVSNDYAAEVARNHPEAFLGAWACVDPWKGKMAVREAERAIKELGMIGLKFQQVAQGFFPNDRRFYPIYEKCVELGAPVLFHTGTTGLGAGMPGGAGFHLKYTKPIPYLDDVAADFPELTIIGAHPSWPWQEEMLAVALHKANVYIDLSGWAPQYFPDTLKREINSRLQDKVLYGSDYPEIPPQRWLAEFQAGGYKPEVMEKVLYKNAQRVLGVGL
ncbi:MAG: amidohydrolase family protein [Dehalococcoidia bacterium]